MRTARSWTYGLERTSRGREAETGLTLGSQEQRRTGEHPPAPVISGRARETTDWPGLDEPYAARIFIGARTLVEQEDGVGKGMTGPGMMRVDRNWKKKIHDNESAQCPIYEVDNSIGNVLGYPSPSGVGHSPPIPSSSPDSPAIHPQRFSHLCSLWLQASQESQGKYT